MKKTLIILAALAMILPATSCKKKTITPETQDQNVVLPETVNKAHQSKIDFTKSSEKIKVEFKGGSSDLKGDLQELNITGTKKYRGKILPEGGSKPQPITGDYSAKPVSKALEGYEYYFEGLGTFIFEPQSDGSIKVTAKIGEETYVATGSVVNNIPEAETPAIQNLCRDWGVESISIDVTGDGIPAGVSADFEGEKARDFAKIAEFIKGKGVDISDKAMKDIAGYSVTCISFDQTGDFTIDFKEKDSFAGKFTDINVSEQTFNYSFENYSENLILAARASGWFKFAKDDAGNDLLGLNINSNVAYNGTKTYVIKLNFILKAI